MSLKKITELLESKNATFMTSGIGLDFKTLHITTENNYTFSVGGSDYKQAYEQLQKNTYKLYL